MVHMLTLSERGGKWYADSRDIAEMTGVRHAYLLEKIDGFVETLRKSTEPKIGFSDFFIETSYQDSTGRKLKRYDCTRKGCDMVANKMTCEKGVLFTAVYVTKFEEMERRLALPSYAIEDPIDRACRWIEEEQKRQALQLETERQAAVITEQSPKVEYHDQILASEGTVNVSQIAKDYAITAIDLNLILRDAGVQYKSCRQWLLTVKYHSLGYAKSTTFFDDYGKSQVRTRWTQEGRLFIHRLLLSKGIRPKYGPDIAGAAYIKGLRKAEYDLRKRKRRRENRPVTVVNGGVTLNIRTYEKVK